MAGVTIDERDIPILREIISTHKGRIRSSQPGPAKRQPKHQAAIRVILHDDLSMFESVDASITQLVSTTEIQRVRFRGTVTGGTFSLTWEPEGNVNDDSPQTADIAYDATQTEFRDALTQQLDLTENDIRVKKLSDGFWLITFLGRYAGKNIPLIEVASDDLDGNVNAVATAQTYWEDTGRVVSVREILGVADPTPLTRGAVCLCHWVNTAGYCVGSVECRDFRWYESEE